MVISVYGAKRYHTVGITNSLSSSFQNSVYVAWRWHLQFHAAFKQL